MLTFLPALILLLLHGPANMEGRLARAGERADVGSRLPAAVPVVAKSNRAFLAELLRKFPGATVLVALAEEPAIESKPAAAPEPALIPEAARPHAPAPPATNQRDRDGPFKV
jgi:hypothetical protein